MCMPMHEATVRTTACCANRCGWLASLAAQLVATIAAYRRPVRHGRRKRRRQLIELAITINHLAAQQGQYRGNVLNLVARHLQVVGGQHRQVGKLPNLNAPLLAFLIGEPGVGIRPEPKRGFAIEQVSLGIQ